MTTTSSVLETKSNSTLDPGTELACVQVPRIVAVEHVRRMRGGAQPHLMRCSDGGHYVVKFMDNPQHQRVLANEWIGARLATGLGLPVPETALVEVSEELINHSGDVVIDMGRNARRSSRHSNACTPD